MRLTRALRISPGMSVALTGAGGKSSALGRIANELIGVCPVILTTSTKLLESQHDLGQMHRVIKSRLQLGDVPRWLEEYDSIILTGPLAEQEPKWLGLDMECLADLRDFARERGAVLLIEADGARGHSLKAPAAHEPVVPEWIDLVVSLVGLDVVGKSLQDSHVHRSDLAAVLLNIPPGTHIEPRNIVDYLRHPLGAKKGVPSGAVMRILLNKSETPGRLASGRVIAKAMLTDPEVASTLICSLVQKDPVLESFWTDTADIVQAYT